MECKSTILYAARTPKGYRDFHPKAWIVASAYSRDCPEIVRVCITPDPSGDYWGWLNTGYFGLAGTVTFVQPTRAGVEVCFVYGPDDATKRGRGELVRVRVEEIP